MLHAEFRRLALARGLLPTAPPVSEPEPAPSPPKESRPVFAEAEAG